MYLWKNLDLIEILRFEIGIWGLDLDLNHGIWDFRIKDLRFLCKIGI